MKHRIYAITILGLIAAMYLTFVVAGCAGTLTRQHVVTPVVQQQWPDIRSKVVRGPTTVPAGLSDFDAAVTTGDAVKLAPLVTSTWPALRDTASANVDATNERAEAKTLEKDRIGQFNEAVGKLAGTP